MHLYLIFGGIAVVILALITILVNYSRIKRLVFSLGTPSLESDNIEKIWTLNLVHIAAVFGLSVGTFSTLLGVIWFFILLLKK